MPGLIASAEPLRAVTRSIAVVVGGVLLCAFGLSACSKHPTQVDPDYFPEGVSSPDARMMLWYDAPNMVVRYKDGPPVGPDIGDPLCPTVAPGDSDVVLDSAEVRRYDPGTVLGMILDATPATGYEVLRREPNGGFRQLRDFSVPPIRRWPQSGSELYSFIDSSPSGAPSYVGRGLVSGAVTSQAPLTNVGELGALPIADVHFTGAICQRDSLFSLSWDPVPGADRYLIHIYTLSNASSAEEMLSGAPTPLYGGPAHDFFVGYLEGPRTSYKLGDTTRTDVRVLLRRQMFFATPYRVRISALDARGQLIACTRGSVAFKRGEGVFFLYRVGAVIVTAVR